MRHSTTNSRASQWLNAGCLFCCSLPALGQVYDAALLDQLFLGHSLAGDRFCSQLRPIESQVQMQSAHL